jgi:hypothetical protein
MRAVALRALLALVLGASVWAIPASASAKSCTYGSFDSTSKLVSWGKRPVITHRESVTFAPHQSETETFTLKKRTVLKGSVRLSSEVSAELGNKIIAKGEAKLAMSMAASGQKSTTTNVKIKRTIRNKSSRSQTYIVFQGAMEGHGTWKRSYCQQISGTVGEVRWESGRWKSWESGGRGHVHCGDNGKNLDRIARKALTYCG